MRGRAKKKFLLANPVCCFCGGQTAAKEVDHQPSESLFSGRNRPKELIFPACSECNRLSHKAEAKLPLIFPEETEDPIKRQAFRDYVRLHGNRKPDLIGSLIPTNRQRRDILREVGAELAPGRFLDDLPIIRLPVSEWQPLLDMLCKKLILAMHYRYEGKPLTRGGRIWFDRVFNFDQIFGRMPDGVNDLILRTEEDPALAIPGQLDVGRYVEDGINWFVINIRHRMLIYGFSTETPDELLDNPAIELFPPLSPAIASNAIGDKSGLGG